MTSRTWKWTLVICRLVLGGVFVFASLDKIAHPAAFSDILFNYQLIPAWMIHPLAAWLPWLELLAGIFLIAGVFVHGAALVSGGLLLIFIAALGINLMRGLSIDCGCFTTTTGSHRGAMIELIIRDLLLLIPAVLIIRQGLIRFRQRSG